MISFNIGGILYKNVIKATFTESMTISFGACSSRSQRTSLVFLASLNNILSCRISQSIRRFTTVSENSSSHEIYKTLHPTFAAIRKTVVLLPLPALAYPPVLIRPEMWLKSRDRLSPGRICI